MQSVELLGSNSALSFRQTAEGLRLGFPEKPLGKYTYIFLIRFATGRS